MRVAAFLSECDTRVVDELAGTERLLAPLVFYSAVLDCEIEAAKYFISDLASVPRIPFAYLVLGGKGKKAAIIHDWLYSGGLVAIGGVLRALTRAEADAVFAEALRAAGYSAWVVNLMYAGVRAGGGSHFSAPNQPQDVASVAAAMEAP